MDGEMKMAVIGSRTIGTVDFAGSLDKLVGIINQKPTEVISGGAKGYDTLAALWAQARHIKLTDYKPDYKKNGRGAPFIRNRRMVDEADLVVAFWDGESRGTKYTIDYARKQDKTIVIFATDGNEIHIA